MYHEAIHMDGKTQNVVTSQPESIKLNAHIHYIDENVYLLRQDLQARAMEVLARMSEPICRCEDSHHADDCRRVIWEESVTTTPDQYWGTTYSCSYQSQV